MGFQFQIHSWNLRMRKIGVGLGEGGGKLAGRIDVAKKNVGDGLRATDAGIPGRQNSFHILRPGHRDGIAGYENDDGAGIGCSYGLDQSILVVGKRKSLGVAAFAHVLADKNDGDFGGFGEIGSGRGIVAIVILHVGVGNFLPDVF